MTDCTGFSRRLRMAAVTALCALFALPALADVPSEPAATDTWETAQPIAEEASSERVIGRAVAIRGQVYAQTPGGAPRLLHENSAIFPGDRLVTSKGAQLGVLSGEYYTGLNADSVLTYRKLGNGAPEVILERGDVRVINAGEGAEASIATPGMRVAASSSDTSAYALPEKAWVVSLVCALEGQVQIEGGSSGQSLLVEQGGCAASKPLEGIFLAGAAGEALPVLAPAGAGAAPGTLAAAPVGAGGPQAATAPPPSGAGPGTPPAGPAAPRFRPEDPVALGGPLLRPGPPADIRNPRILEPCDSPMSGCGASRAVTVPQQPTNPFVGGTQPPL